MATAETALKARMSKLKKQADELGIMYQDSVDEQTLRSAIKDFRDAAKESDKSTKEEKAAAEAAARNVDASVEIAKAVAREVATAMRKGNEEGRDQLYDERDIDPDDVTREKIYFAPMWFWIVNSKRVGGQLVKPPYGKMIFKMDQGSAVLNGDQWQTAYKCTYKTNSKKEQAYLETHPLFGRAFFLNAEEANITTDQMKLAHRFGKHLANLGTKMAPDLYRLGAKEGIKLDRKMSLQTLRTEIANALAQREHELAKFQEKELAKAGSRASLLTHSEQ